MTTLTHTALALLVVPALAGCAQSTAEPATNPPPAAERTSVPASSPPSTSTPPSPPSAPGAAASVTTDPSAAATSWLTTLLSSDTRTDDSPTDAQHRATVWAVGGLAEPDPEPLNGPGAEWYALTDAGGRYEVALKPAVEDQPADTPTDAWRLLIATQTPVDAGGQPAGEPITGIYRIHLAFTEHGWRVQEYQLS